MLKFNFKKIFIMKGIKHPIPFLKKGGFDKYQAFKFKNNKVKTITPELIEKFCLVTKCEPYDFMEWYPDDETLKSLPLKKLIVQNKRVASITSITDDLPLSKYPELIKMVEELKKEKT